MIVQVRGPFNTEISEERRKAVGLGVENYISHIGSEESRFFRSLLLQKVAYFVCLMITLKLYLYSRTISSHT